MGCDYLSRVMRSAGPVIFVTPAPGAIPLPARAGVPAGREESQPTAAPKRTAAGAECRLYRAVKNILPARRRGRCGVGRISMICIFCFVRVVRGRSIVRSEG